MPWALTSPGQSRVRRQYREEVRRAGWVDGRVGPDPPAGVDGQFPQSRFAHDRVGRHSASRPLIRVKGQGGQEFGWRRGVAATAPRTQGSGSWARTRSAQAGQVGLKATLSRTSGSRLPASSASISGPVSIRLARRWAGVRSELTTRLVLGRSPALHKTDCSGSDQFPQVLTLAPDGTRPIALELSSSRNRCLSRRHITSSLVGFVLTSWWLY